MLILNAAVTNRVTAQVWKSKKNPFVPKTGFVSRRGTATSRPSSNVTARLSALGGGVLRARRCWCRLFAFAIEGLKAPELAAYGLIVPDGIRDIAVAAVAVFALLLAVLGGVPLAVACVPSSVTRSRSRTGCARS